MSFVVRFRFVTDDGVVLHDQSTFPDVSSAVRSLERDMTIFGSHGTLTIEFDPPIVADTAPLDANRLAGLI